MPDPFARYDDWLERPYEEAAEAELAQEAREEACEHEWGLPHLVAATDDGTRHYVRFCHECEGSYEYSETESGS